MRPWAERDDFGVAACHLNMLNGVKGGPKDEGEAEQKSDEDLQLVRDDSLHRYKEHRLLMRGNDERVRHDDEHVSANECCFRVGAC